MLGGLLWGAAALLLLVGQKATAQNGPQEKVVEQAGNWVMAISNNVPAAPSTNSGARLFIAPGIAATEFTNFGSSSFLVQIDYRNG
jgi:hypothetical protein